MKKLILLITVSLISISISAQNKDTECDYYQSELEDFKINEILHYTISNLINNLKVKVNSDLNTLSSILLNYKFSEQLHLKAKEQSRLQMRMMEMADRSYEQRKLIFVRVCWRYFTNQWH